MKRIMWMALLALPFCVERGHAQININHSCHVPGIPPICINCNNPIMDFHLFAGGGRTQLGPWYQYWPYQAHFQSPAPMGMGGGPYMMTLPPGFGQAPMMQYGAPVPVGPPQYAQQQWNMQAPTPVTAQQQPPARPQQPMYQPVGYYYQSTVPSYWYGK